MFRIQDVGQSHAFLRGQRFQIVIDAAMLLHHPLAELLHIVALPVLNCIFAQFYLGQVYLAGRQQEILIRRRDCHGCVCAGNRNEKCHRQYNHDLRGDGGSDDEFGKSRMGLIHGGLWFGDGIHN
jgi:hypothetical protein